MRPAIFGLLAASLLAASATAQRAGTLISADPVVDTPGGMQAWRIQYWTQTDRNRAIRTPPVQAARGIDLEQVALFQDARFRNAVDDFFVQT